MENTNVTLLSQIENYCREHNLSASRFGRDVMNDPSFINDVTNGRKIRKTTRERIAKVIGVNPEVVSREA